MVPNSLIAVVSISRIKQLPVLAVATPQAIIIIPPSLQIFQMIENPHEVDTLETYQALLISKREVFLRSVWNESSNNVNYREVVETVEKS